ncbi:MAG TPA: Ig domain-containing protein [Myxococcales bacterium LLY-WYZ-16_1]|nr:Ig domain-containing protein [Myxococcales bacterium LLY-WYZ-16_1]
MCTTRHTRTAVFLVALGASAAACGDDEPLNIQPPSLPSAEVGRTYTATLSVDGELGGIEWSVPFGELPQGLALAGLSESGEPTGRRVRLAGEPVSVGTFSFTVRANGDGDRIQRQYVLRVLGETNPLRITTASLPTGSAGVPYDGLLNGDGGTETGYEWTASGLPDGLELDRFGTPRSRISGTPTETGLFSVEVTLTDAGGARTSRRLELVVDAPGEQLRIETERLPAGVVSVPYEAEITAVGGPDLDMTWFAESLPPGLRLEGGTPTARILGTPTEVGSSAVLITVLRGNDDTAERAFTLTVQAPSPLALLTRTVPSGVVDMTYLATLEAAGGVGEYTWTTDPELPDGLTLLSGTPQAEISGIPTVSGDFEIEVTVEDEAGTQVTREILFAIAGTGPTIQPAGIPAARAGEPFTVSIEATGGVEPYVWAVASGSLPDGVTIEDPASNPVVLSGTPTVPGLFNFDLRVTDADALEDTESLAIEVEPPELPLTITSTFVPPGTVGAAYLGQVNSSGGSGINVGWTLVDPLPPGLQSTPVNGRDLLLFGTATSSGSFPVLFEVRDSSGGFDSETFTFEITED